MSTTIAISGNTPILSADFNPPIYLDDNKDYFLGLADFESFNSIPNIESEVNAICIDCNICVGSFSNGRPVHIIHQFFPAVAPGYKIVESPLPILYFPVSVKTINNITVKIVDQDGDLINFRKETITVRLHLKSDI